jgi:hypothetical protein
MVEATTRSAELQDVEPGDFVRFLEYAYRGDYTVPAWTVDESALATNNIDVPDDDVAPAPEEPAYAPVGMEIEAVPEPVPEDDS